MLPGTMPKSPSRARMAPLRVTQSRLPAALAQSALMPSLKIRALKNALSSRTRVANAVGPSKSGYMDAISSCWPTSGARNALPASSPMRATISEGGAIGSLGMLLGFAGRHAHKIAAFRARQGRRVIDDADAPAEKVHHRF